MVRRLPPPQPNPEQYKQAAAAMPPCPSVMATTQQWAIHSPSLFQRAFPRPCALPRHSAYRRKRVMARRLPRPPSFSPVRQSWLRRNKGQSIVPTCFNGLSPGPVRSPSFSLPAQARHGAEEIAAPQGRQLRRRPDARSACGTAEGRCHMTRDRERELGLPEE